MRNPYEIALAFIKYRNGQIHLFKFKDHTGFTVPEAIEKYPWLTKVYFEKDISKHWHDT